MADEPQWESGDRPLSAEEVASSTFPTAFRGFDPVEVRTFLARVADELRAAAERESELRAGLESAGPPSSEEARAEARSEVRAELEAARGEAARLTAELQETEARLADREAALTDREAGVADREDRARLRDADAAEQSGRALASAKEEAAQVVAQARDEASRVVRDAREEAARLGSEADRVLADAREAAAAAGIEERRDAERDAAVIRVKAREEADAIIEAAKERGREMVAEAQAARERMLKDLAKRRRSAQAQLEHLKEARDRVLEHLRLARRAVDDITTRFEPVEARWDVGTTAEQLSPAQPAAAPPPPGERAQITAVQAQNAVTTTPGPEPPAPSRQDSPSPGPSTGSAGSTGEPGIPDAPVEVEASSAAGTEDDVRPATREERKSSALRILRRGRSQPEPAASAQRGDAVEGVRLIGPPPRVTPDASEPAPEPDAEALPEPAPQSEAEAVPEPARPLDHELEASEPVAEPPEGPDGVAPEETHDDDAPSEPAAKAGEPASEAVEEEDGPQEEEPREPVRPGETLDELFARLRAGREHAVAEATGETHRRETETPVSDSDELALQRRDVAVEESEATMVRRLKRAMQDEQNAVLDALRTLRGPVTIEGLLGAPESQQQRFRRLAGPILGQAAAAGASVSPAAAPAVDDLVEAFATEVSTTLRDRLHRALAQAQGEELEPSSVAERLNAVYRDFKGQRAERIGAHFVTAAHSRGAFDVVANGTTLRWVVDDGGPCPDCDDNALAGAVVKGDSYPTGQAHPPAHVGCRCILVPASGG